MLGDMTERACENCGTPDDELLLVHRVYVQPETWDQAATETVVAEAELWCISCCSQYPHNSAESDEDEPADDAE